MARQAQKSAADVAAKWSTNLGAAGDTIKRGVGAVQTAPTALAARNPDGYLAGVQRAVSSGKWQQRLNSVSLQAWQNAMVNKGISRVQTGAQYGKPNVQNFMQAFLPAVYSARDSLQSMPRGTLEQNIGRMNAFVRAMAQFQYNRT